MCNLYRLAPKNDLERYLLSHSPFLVLPHWPEKDMVGPFETGVVLVSDGKGGLAGRTAQWGMIRPGQAGRIEYKERSSTKPGGTPRKEPLLTNCVRLESVAKLLAFKESGAVGMRCLIPATWLAEPNWETGQCLWWNLSRADGLPWMIAGLLSEWMDPDTAEIVSNFAFITFNVNEHPILSRLHRPELDPLSEEPLPMEYQDKRGEAHIEPRHWETWLNGSVEDAFSLLVPPEQSFFDLLYIKLTDQLPGARQTCPK